MGPRLPSNSQRELATANWQPRIGNFSCGLNASLTISPKLCGALASHCILQSAKSASNNSQHNASTSQHPTPLTAFVSTFAALNDSRPISNAATRLRRRLTPRVTAWFPAQGYRRHVTIFGYNQVCPSEECRQTRPCRPDRTFLSLTFGTLL